MYSNSFCLNRTKKWLKNIPVVVLFFACNSLEAQEKDKKQFFNDGFFDWQFTSEDKRISGEKI
jgi:hypothetical protein